MIVITEIVYDETTKRNRVVVSHGINEDDKLIILPNVPIEYMSGAT